MAKNIPSAATDELLAYGSLSEPIQKIRDLSKTDYPSEALAKSLESLLSEDVLTANTAEGAGVFTDAASELKDRVQKAARSKVAKMFEVFTPPDVNSQNIAMKLAGAVAAKAELGAGETGAVIVNPKFWSESKARPDATFSPRLVCNVLQQC